MAMNLTVFEGFELFPVSPRKISLRHRKFLISPYLQNNLEPFPTVHKLLPKHPVTKPNIRVIERSEHHLADIIDGMMEEAVRDREVILCESDI